MQLISLLIITVFLSSCSSLKSDKKDQSNPAQTEVSESFDNNSPTTDGSYFSGSSKIHKTGEHDRQVYFLYGGEHLKLKNNYFDIPVVYNAAVKKWMDYFLGRGRKFFERYSGRAGRYAPVLSRILKEHGLPRDLIFLAMAESGFQNKAKSWAKAVGPWQFMPYTGKAYGLHIDWYIDERRDPIKASIAASQYLTKLYKQFGAWELATAAYNAGEGKISRAIRRYGTHNFWKIRKGRYLKPETKNYVPKIMALAIIGKNLKTFGLEDIDFDSPLDFDEVEVPALTDLHLFAEKIDVPVEDISYYNPEIVRWFTPPGKTYRLRLPKGHISKWPDCCSETEIVAKAFQSYKVRGKRSKLKDVARKFRLKPYVLQDMNGNSLKTRVAKGTVITLPFREGQSRRAKMYADLYERPRKSILRKRQYKRMISLAKRRGKRIKSPKRYYTVRKGDTLWAVAKKAGISLDTLIVSNLSIIKRRMIRSGDRLAVR